MGGLMSRTREWLSPENAEAAELKDDAEHAGCCLIKNQPERCVGDLHGTFRSLTLGPVDGVRALEAEL